MALGALIAGAVIYWIIGAAWREMGRLDRYAEENDA